MGDVRVFALPDVGEGLTEAELLSWHVRPGDVVTVNQAICEIETAKAAVELPCPFAGKVVDLHAAPGQVIPVGAPLIGIEVEGTVREPVLVGYGVKETTAPARRARRGKAAASAAPVVAEDAPVEVVAEIDLEPQVDQAEPQAETVEPAAVSSNGADRARAKPIVRKLAKDMGVDINALAGSGPRGEVTREDVLAAAGGERTPMTAGADEIVPVRGVLRAMADAMVASKFSAPHVTIWLDVDVTRTLTLVKQLREHPAYAGTRVTPLTIVAAAVARTAKEFPRINATWRDHTDGADIVMHGAVHLGIAADTPRGLLVPVLKNVQAMKLPQLAGAITGLIETARAGRSTPADLTGGTIAITNVGVFGIDGGTPIINPGQTAIIAMGQIVERPWVVEGNIVVRPIMQLSMSFDHRVIDGAIGSRALKAIADFVADPAVGMLLTENG